MDFCTPPTTITTGYRFLTLKGSSSRLGEKGPERENSKARPALPQQTARFTWSTGETIGFRRSSANSSRPEYASYLPFPVIALSLDMKKSFRKGDSKCEEKYLQA